MKRYSADEQTKRGIHRHNIDLFSQKVGDLVKRNQLSMTTDRGWLLNFLNKLTGEDWVLDRTGFVTATNKYRIIDAVLKEIKRGQMENQKEMEDWFKQRTNRHIGLVQYYCRKIYEYDPARFPNIIKLGKVHDQSKFNNPEYDPYVLITWDYRCKDKGVKFTLPDDIKKQMNMATNVHILTNQHHPEFWSPKEANLINREDKPPEEMVDATKMTDEAIGEMAADWCAMSTEKGNTPQQWADKNVNIRWKFTDKQKVLIYELLNEIWE